jgi:3-isopropylmalate/(R)-2-methylmalate dehydratase small subunit
MISIIQTIAGKLLPLPGNDIDTDRIIPARFMKVVTFDGLGRHAFHDVRFDENGAPREHPFNDAKFAGHDILLVGRNFGCGSSREHAPQALAKYGIRAIVGQSFADIFAGNCAAIGIVAVTVSAEESAGLFRQAQSASCDVVIDLEQMTVATPTGTIGCAMPQPTRRAFLEGTWDMTALLLANLAAIQRVSATLPYLNWSGGKQMKCREA